MTTRNLIGSKLANFEIQRLIERGGMADVYLGMDVKLHRLVAIKVFAVQPKSKSGWVDRFVQEARMMANWRHENIVQIFYAGDENGLFYYVMEYIDGYDLASILSVYEEKAELMPIDDVLRIGDSIASALDYAHAQGVIHRDVKPANIMIAKRDGRVVLGDFGLALDLRDKSQGEVFGSPHYIAPEQARRSSDAIPQSDLYSLGVILYEMVTGAIPFDDLSPASIALQHITDTPPPPRSINPSISVQVEEVLLKALEKSPEDRYQSGRDMMNALRAAFVSGPVKPLPEDSALPPIPVNAPTIRRSDVSLNSFTRRNDVVTALEEKKSTIHQRDDDEWFKKRIDMRNFGWIALTIIFILAVWSLAKFRPDLINQWFTTQEEPALQFPVTNTALPEPTFTPALPTTRTATSPTAPIETATVTQTEVPSKTPTNTPTSIPTVVSATPAPTQAGYLMTAHYTENSFYVVDRGNVSRSLSGFVFERIDENSVIQQRFEGWKWERYFDVIQPERCVGLLIYQSPQPYSRPAECENKVLSTLILHKDSNEAFWLPDVSGDQFRILWLNNEIARCEVKEGLCDFYVP